MKTTGLSQIRIAQPCILKAALAVLFSFGLCFLTPTAKANIVGYVNVPLTNGYNFIANPLDFPPNALTNLVSFPPNGSRAYCWDVTNQVFHPTATFGPSSWNLNYNIPVGRGFVVYVPIKYTNTFVGNVIAPVPGTTTQEIIGSNRFSLIGCMYPVGGQIGFSGTNTINFPRIDGATAHFFRQNQTFDSYTCFTDYGWFDPKAGVSTNGPLLNVGDGFFVQNPGPATNWVTTVGPRPAAPSPGSPDILLISVQGGAVTLTVSNPSTTGYDVQFSADGEHWLTIAANQSGRRWIGPLPDTLQGQFRVVASSQMKGGAK
jgi:hypothetical protein